MRKRFAALGFLVLLPFAALAARSAIAADEPISSGEQDGIVADLRVVEDQAVVRWRFLKQLDRPIEEINAQLDGQPLGLPILQTFPGPGEQTRVLALIDMTGKNRSAE